MAQLIYGKNTVLDAIHSDVEVFEVFVSPQNKNLVENFKGKVTVMNKNYLDGLTPGNHQGMIAKVAEFEYATLKDLHNIDKENKTVLVLDQIEDPYNFGAIIRTADATGVDAIIIQDKRQVGVTPTVSKVSTGASNHMMIIKVSNITNALRDLKENNFWVVATDASNAQDYRTVDYNMNSAIVIGSEGKGIRDLVLKNSDIRVFIPMEGTVSSLNASVAAAQLMYQAYNSKNPIK